MRVICKMKSTGAICFKIGETFSISLTELGLEAKAVAIGGMLGNFRHS